MILIYQNTLKHAYGCYSIVQEYYNGECVVVMPPVVVSCHFFYPTFVYILGGKSKLKTLID